MGAADQPPITPDKARSAPSRSKPTSSHQRSGPKIKRLLNLGTKPGMAFPDTEDPKWKQLVAEWEQLDLDPHGLYIHLATAQQQRSNFENDLRRSRDESDPSIEILERALAHAEPLIRFLLKERDDDQEPRMECDAAVQRAKELGVGSGINSLEFGMRLRYEIRREFAPYIGVSWQRQYGETADLTRARGESVRILGVVLGLRAWF